MALVPLRLPSECSRLQWHRCSTWLKHVDTVSAETIGGLFGGLASLLVGWFVGCLVCCLLACSLACLLTSREEVAWKLLAGSELGSEGLEQLAEPGAVPWDRQHGFHWEKAGAYLTHGNPARFDSDASVLLQVGQSVTIFM